jgi:CRISPR/Cas system CMR-associated protein Cmr5 small subunit
MISSLALKAKARKPECSTGTLVIRKAPTMIIINGIVAFFTSLLARINPPHIISKKATIYIT